MRSCAHWNIGRMGQKAEEKQKWFLRDFTGMLGGILFTFYQEGSQETVATMVGMALGMVLAQVTRGNPRLDGFSVSHSVSYVWKVNGHLN
ncbi:hypothetical protein QJS10_CPB14g01332 [Acorus calamus]|uniref:Uncharacterized protein n=1 Tax=Acorus calamus TaxID=4465 RepID=A0AAV9DG85_ACOCL|nr:hypothetical protein QJS10_CPB14g01332 [Acorus calamus]